MFSLYLKMMYHDVVIIIKKYFFRNNNNNNKTTSNNTQHHLSYIYFTLVLFVPNLCLNQGQNRQILKDF